MLEIKKGSQFGLVLTPAMTGTVYPPVKNPGGYSSYTDQWPAKDEPKFIVTYNSFKSEESSFPLSFWHSCLPRKHLTLRTIAS